MIKDKLATIRFQLLSSSACHGIPRPLELVRIFGTICADCARGLPRLINAFENDCYELAMLKDNNPDADAPRHLLDVLGHSLSGHIGAVYYRY